MKFTVIVVCLNSKEALNYTLESILKQDFTDYEILIKDGGSTDGSIEKIPSDAHIRLEVGKDSGIYDAMNRAVKMAKGDFVLFMNCGDCFAGTDVLTKVSACIDEYAAKHEAPVTNAIFYGDTKFCASDSVSKAPPKITGFVCYRNIPCHQSIVYSKDTLTKRGFDTKYSVRADNEHFLYSFFKGGCEFTRVNCVIAGYEGGGFSESRANSEANKREYKEIVAKYIPWYKRFVYRLILIVTFYKLRGALASSKRFGKVYQALKGMLYR